MFRPHQPKPPSFFFTDFEGFPEFPVHCIRFAKGNARRSSKRPCAAGCGRVGGLGDLGLKSIPIPIAKGSSSPRRQHYIMFLILDLFASGTLCAPWDATSYWPSTATMCPSCSGSFVPVVRKSLSAVAGHRL